MVIGLNTEYSPQEGYPPGYIWSDDYEIYPDKKYQLIMHCNLPDGTDRLESDIYLAGRQWPYLSLIEIDPPGDVYLNNDGLDTLRRRYRMPDGSAFTESQIAELNAIVEKENNHGYDTYSEYIKLRSSYDPVAREYIVDIYALYPNVYDIITGPCLWFDPDWPSHTDQDGGFPVNIESYPIEGMELTDPYKRHAIKVLGAQPGVNYQLRHNGGL